MTDENPWNSNKKAGLSPGLKAHSTNKLELNRHPMRRRRFAPMSHTQSHYCVFASSTRHDSTRTLVPRQSPVLVTPAQVMVPLCVGVHHHPRPGSVLIKTLPRGMDPIGRDL